MNSVWALFKWAAGEAWEKLNIIETWRELKDLGKKYGVRFFIVAVLWEIIEDGVFPALAWWMGVPQLIPLFLIFHFEPVVYPVFFWVFRTWDRLQGNEPWTVSRPAYSSHWRSFTKVTAYRMMALAPVMALLVSLNISWVYAAAYTLVMGVFSFVHERTWHDSNFGIIVETDKVEPKRNFAKAGTYRLVSLLMMGTFLNALLGSTPWGHLVIYQAVMFSIYLAHEFVWSKITLGIQYEGSAVVELVDINSTAEGDVLSFVCTCGTCGTKLPFTVMPLETT